jgi:hypothetical protein
MPSHRQIREALKDIVEGRIVKRAKHDLRWRGGDVSPDFIEVLQEQGYEPMLVKDAEVKPGERAPAFYVDNATAFFGWIFWEKFTSLKLRKLFGSIVRNSKGDWAIQIPPHRRTVVYVNMASKTEMDIDNPSAF